jgi:hypothetical protein
VLFNPGVTAEIMPVSDGRAAGDACNPVSTVDRAAVNGHLALINRGVCGFVDADTQRGCSPREKIEPAAATHRGSR